MKTINMSVFDKKEIFKLVIQEFMEFDIPKVFERELMVPLDSKKVITIFGPRRSGKSYYFYALINKLIQKKVSRNRLVYISFEDDRLLPLNSKDLGNLLEAYFEMFPENKKKKIFLFLDEIQNIQGWEVFVRRIYDKEKVRIFITGSSSKLLHREIATSLRGRTLSFGLYPPNFREFLMFRGEMIDKNYELTGKRFVVKKMLEEYLEFGSFPEIILSRTKEAKKKILKEYFDLLVYRDLAERFSIENTELLKDMLKYLFTNINESFSANAYHKSVHQTIPSSRETVYEYINAIKETGYFSLLPIFSYSLKEQRVNANKIVALDNGLRNRMAFRFSKDYGKLAENAVGSYLAKDGGLYYWKNKGEVDFVIMEEKKLIAVNVTYGEKIEDRELKSLREFKKKYPKTKKLLLITKDEKKIDRGIEFIPLHKFLLSNIK